MAGAVAAAVTPLQQAPAQVAAAESKELRVPVGATSLFTRMVGRGRPVIVLHGGPDFDQAYLLPEFDRLADQMQLIYYDQRGRGRSAEGVGPDDVTIESDVTDLDQVREYIHRPRVTLLGHSWGAVLALEYALRHPDRVEALILMNPAPASAADVAALRSAYVAQLGPEAMSAQRALLGSEAYKAGNPDTVAARYRIHFKHAFQRPEGYELLMTRMKAAFIRQGSAGVLKARAAEDRLYEGTWSVPGYDLMPKLKALQVPTLVIAGEKDFIPLSVAEHIAGAIPQAKFVVIPKCGHFGYIECPAETRAPVEEFLRGLERH